MHPQIYAGQPRFPARKEVRNPMDYASKDIRNILVAGHAGCGKTTLVEALLYMSGATERMGRVDGELMERIDAAIAVSFGLGNTQLI